MLHAVSFSYRITSNITYYIYGKMHLFRWYNIVKIFEQIASLIISLNDTIKYYESWNNYIINKYFYNTIINKSGRLDYLSSPSANYWNVPDIMIIRCIFNYRYPRLYNKLRNSLTVLRSASVETTNTKFTSAQDIEHCMLTIVYVAALRFASDELRFRYTCSGIQRHPPP